jgi:hypothetical protein
MQNGNSHHRVAFRHQRAIFVFVVLGLIILFSTAVLWGHYETVVTRYQWLAKAGLALVDVIAVGLAIWHLYTKHTPLKVWCYAADGIIAAMMIVHAGAVLQLDSSTAQQVAQVKTATEAQARLREADAQVEAARIKAAAEAAASIKQQTGSTSLARQAIRSAETKADNSAALAITEKASQIKPQTFLSDDYMSGGVYYWPALVALFFFFVAIGISAIALPYEEASETRSAAASSHYERQTAGPAHGKPVAVWRGGKQIGGNGADWSEWPEKTSRPQ